jgi:hypothetical protein
VSEEDLEVAAARTADYVAAEQTKLAAVVALVGRPARERAQNAHNRAVNATAD